jgi:hypothetical protein
MSQSALSIPNEAGASFRADVNAGLQALASQSAGSSAPSTTYAYQPWFDTSTTPPTLRIRNAANNAWAVAGTLTTGNVFNPVGLTIDSSGNVTAVASSASAALNIGAGKFYIDANGNAGMNNTSPPSWGSTMRALHMGSVASFAGETSGSAMMSDNAYFDGSNWKYMTTAIAGQWVVDYTGSAIFRRANSGAAGSNITWSEITRANAYGIGLGGTVPSSGMGIAFPPTQVASSDANTLDDYEEGTWTPTIFGTATYGFQVGTYVKIGSVVYAYFRINISSLGTGSTTGLAGFPFPVLNTPQYDGGVVSYFSNLATSVYSLVIQMQANTTTCTFAGTNSSTTNILNGPAVFKTSTEIHGTVVYRTN